MAETQVTRDGDALLLAGQDDESILTALEQTDPLVTSIVLKASPDLTTVVGLDLSGWTALRSLTLADAHISQFDVALPASLEELILRNNSLEEVPQSIFGAVGLRVLNVAGNKIRHLSGPFDAMPKLEALYLGANRIDSIAPGVFACMPSLRVLYLGGNQLTTLPEEIGELPALRSLWLHDNALEAVPAAVLRLNSLERLYLHQNKLNVLPAELLTLRRLKALSVRQNPLMSKFADTYRPALPSLFELAARMVIKNKDTIHDFIPATLMERLRTTRCCHACNNPVFSQTVSHIDFLDLCGAYQVPFLQYLCSGKCSEHVEAATLDPVTRAARLRKLLLDRYNPSASAPIEDLRNELSTHWDEEFD